MCKRAFLGNIIVVLAPNEIFLNQRSGKCERRTTPRIVAGEETLWTRSRKSITCRLNFYYEELGLLSGVVDSSNSSRPGGNLDRRPGDRRQLESYVPPYLWGSLDLLWLRGAAPGSTMCLLVFEALRQRGSTVAKNMKSCSFQRFSARSECGLYNAFFPKHHAFQ